MLSRAGLGEENSTFANFNIYLKDIIQNYLNAESVDDLGDSLSVFDIDFDGELEEIPEEFELMLALKRVSSPNFYFGDFYFGYYKGFPIVFEIAPGAPIGVFYKYSDFFTDSEELEDSMTDAEADADTLKSAGWGTDEDYGVY
jgi:hypothetical protein